MSTVSSRPPDTRSAALSYAEQFGLSLFPCAPRAKTPLGGSHGWHDATTDLAQIDRWWSRIPDANLGLALAPSELVVLDVDERNGGRDRLADLERQYGALPETWHEHTGARLTGDHYLYRRLPGVPPTKSVLAEGVEVLATGYIVCAPSINPDGGVYRWCLGEEPWTLPLAEAPGWVTAPLRAKPAPGTGSAATGSVADSLLGRAFQHAGWWLRSIDDTRAAVLCPWRDLHSTGRSGDSSTVLFAPITIDRIGKFHCSHAHCEGRTVREVLAALPAEAVARAEAALGRSGGAVVRTRSAATATIRMREASSWSR